MFPQPGKVSFNEEWVKSVTKVEFLVAQSHLKDVVNLSEAYDKIVGVTKKKKDVDNISNAEESTEA
jgi:hypothetical protein